MRHRTLVLATLLLLLLALPTAAQQEGYDPMRILASNSSPPNVVIALDTSDAMNRCEGGAFVGPDAAGGPPSGGFNAGVAGSTAGCTGGKAKIWIYTLTVTQALPSKLAIVKNALGNSVSVYPTWVPPATWPAYTNNWSGASVTVTTTYTAPTDTVPTATWRFDFRGTFSQCKSASQVGAPFSTSGLFVGYTSPQAPRNLVGGSSGAVNWGLVTYGGTGCPGATLRVPVNPNDTGDASAILNLMRPYASGGLSAGGSVSTRGALQVARGHLADVFASDPRFDCNRTYGVLLVAGGVSDACNGVTGPWTSCPSGYQYSPAMEAENLWNATFTNGGTSVVVNGRTWVLGMAPANSMPCELNYTAYRGRTDANSPNGDMGMLTEADPYLPGGTPGTYDTAHGNYAFPASTPADFEGAFLAVLSSSATAGGNFVWNAITVTARTGLPTLAGLVGTSEYPGWKGHLYVYDLQDGSLLYDVGDRLQARDLNANPRRIWTWDNRGGLVEVTSANLSALNTICGCSLNSNVVDFIHGKDIGSYTRTWRLGSPINSVPAVVSGPSVWDTSEDQSPSHKMFEQTYAGRHSIIYLGASDGLMHAFDAIDGFEVFAILPPDQLARQITRYNNWVANPVASPMGQPGSPTTHLYGVANSPRVGDVFFPSGNSGSYKTVLFLSQGPGAQSVAALDITHPYPGRSGVSVPGMDPPLYRTYLQDPNYSASAPFELMWFNTNANISQLKFSYSVPAMASTVASGTDPDFQAAFGSGYNPASTVSAPVAPTLLALDATDGSANNAVTLANVTTPPPYVGNQAFANGVMYPIGDRIYQEGYPVNTIIQADLNGRIWFLPRPSGTTPVAVVDATAHAGQHQPIYYAPAVAALKSRLLMVFGSGTYYEKSPNINGTTDFRGRIYITAKPEDFSVIPPTDTGKIRSWLLTDLDDGTGAGTTFSDRASITAQPTLLVPRGDQGNAMAVFSVYDPGGQGCGGRTAILTLSFDPENLSSASVTSYDISAGLIVGFGIYGTSIYTAVRDSSGNLTVQKLSGVTISSGGGNQLRPVWWRELQ